MNRVKRYLLAFASGAVGGLVLAVLLALAIPTWVALLTGCAFGIVLGRVTAWIEAAMTERKRAWIN
jgi:xanthosine utilization system XapX-like protein